MGEQERQGPSPRAPPRGIGTEDSEQSKWLTQGNCSDRVASSSSRPGKASLGESLNSALRDKMGGLPSLHRSGRGTEGQGR